MVCFWQQPTGHVIGSRDQGGLEAVITRYWIVVTFKCDGYGDIWHFINVRRGQKVKGQGQHHLKGRLWAFLALALYDEIFLYVRPHQIWTNAYSQHRDWSRNACPFLKRFLRTLERRSNLAEVWSWKVQKSAKMLLCLSFVWGTWLCYTVCYTQMMGPPKNWAFHRPGWGGVIDFQKTFYAPHFVAVAQTIWTYRVGCQKFDPSGAIPLNRSAQNMQQFSTSFWLWNRGINVWFWFCIVWILLF